MRAINRKSVLLVVTATIMPNVCTAETVTYAFTAKITDNGGVEYFAKDTEITGSFTYDKDARTSPSSGAGYARYPSPKNKLILNYQGQKFVGRGKKYIVGVLSRTSESFAFRACDIQLPKGWKIDHSSESDGYGIFLVNYPSRGVIEKKNRPPLPANLSLSDFDSHELRLNFGAGVEYPQGRIDSRATVSAQIISLKLGRDNTDDGVGQKNNPQRYGEK